MQLPFAAKAFDRVYILEAGCHVPDKARMARECARMLRPGGVFVGLDWMRRAGLSLAEEARYIEPICRLHSVPDLVTLEDWGRALDSAGLAVEALENAAVHGDILRNWELLDDKTFAGLHGVPIADVPIDLRMVTEGGWALAEGARSGAFLIGHWRARTR